MTTAPYITVASIVDSTQVSNLQVNYRKLSYNKYVNLSEFKKRQCLVSYLSLHFTAVHCTRTTRSYFLVCDET